MWSMMATDTGSAKLKLGSEVLVLATADHRGIVGPQALHGHRNVGP